MAAAEGETPAEDEPREIEDQLRGFEGSVGSLDPLEQAKLDLMSAYTLNSLFWMYLVTRGINPREHAVKQELERIRTYMMRVKDITDRKKAARLDKGAAARFVRNALYDAEEGGAKRPTPGRAPKTQTQIPAKRPKNK
ncbi:hypothetical protein CRUP_033782 [Coryphaenoides rupestris]|nr:hypothetical protein CRUP_033782 [Coryphaenoides rupestris]